MKTSRVSIFFALFIVNLFNTWTLTAQPTIRALYITYWNHAGMNEIDWNLPTHIIYSYITNDAAPPAIAISPNGPGGDAAAETEMVKLVHSHHKKVLINFQDNPTYWYTHDASAYLRAIMNYIYSRGYDGIDMDIEYGITQHGHQAEYAALMAAIRDSLNARGGNKEISGYVGIEPPDAAMFKTIVQNGDMSFVLMQSYDFSGTWLSNTWHVSPLYNGNLRQASPRLGDPNPCIDDCVQIWRASGFPMSKLCIGATARSNKWYGGNGVCLLNQDGTVSGTCSGGATMNHEGWQNGSIPNFYASDNYNQWKPLYSNSRECYDSVCKAAYISVDEEGSAHDVFYSFDNGYTLADKWRYCRQNGLGGVFVWDFGGSYMSGYPPSSRWPWVGPWLAAVLGVASPSRTGSLNETPHKSPPVVEPRRRKKP